MDSQEWHLEFSNKINKYSFDISGDYGIVIKHPKKIKIIFN